MSAICKEVNPVFIIGSGRCGSSILTWCLGRHPNLLNIPETYWLAQLAIDAAVQYRMGSVAGRFSHLSWLELTDDDFFRHWGQTVHQFILDSAKNRMRKMMSRRDLPLSQLQSAQCLATRWVDGSPYNTHYIFGLNKLFPEARFIHLIRDPNEVATSFYNFSRTDNKKYSWRHGYRIWITHVRSALQAERALGSDKVLILEFHDLIKDSEQTLRSICSFIGENYSSTCLNPLGKKINSSCDSNSPRNGGMGIGRLATMRLQSQAQSIYQSVHRNTGPKPFDQETYETMEQEFWRQVDRNRRFKRWSSRLARLMPAVV